MLDRDLVELGRPFLSLLENPASVLADSEFAFEVYDFLLAKASRVKKKRSKLQGFLCTFSWMKGKQPENTQATSGW